MKISTSLAALVCSAGFALTAQAADLWPTKPLRMIVGYPSGSIAVSSAKRSPLAPTLPGMEEVGAKGVNVEVWNAVMTSAKMPAANLQRLRAELEKIIASREIRQKLFLQGWRLDDVDAKALSARIAQDTVIYGDVIARNNIKLD